jgi:hypothetical protein
VSDVIAYGNGLFNDANKWVVRLRVRQRGERSNVGQIDLVSMSESEARIEADAALAYIARNIYPDVCDLGGHARRVSLVGLPEYIPEHPDWWHVRKELLALGAKVRDRPEEVNTQRAFLDGPNGY